MPDALISIKPQFVDKMINMEKTVEIRSRKVQLEKQSKLWVYTTLPEASLQIFTHVKTVDIDDPKTIWNRYRASIGVPRDIFYQYVNGSKSVSAIVTERIFRLPFDIPLSKIRSMVPNFHPPQFLKIMQENDPLLLAILKILNGNEGR